MSTVIARGIVAATIAVCGIAFAQTPPAPAAASNIKRTPLQTVDVPGTSLNAVTGIAEVVPNAAIGRHTHNGPETGYLMEGELTLMVDGQAPRTLKPGESYQIPAGTPHDARSGAAGAKVLAVYIVEKGKPLATPAP